jgi:hypothetical protein
LVERFGNDAANGLEHAKLQKATLDDDISSQTTRHTTAVTECVEINADYHSNLNSLEKEIYNLK